MKNLTRMAEKMVNRRREKSGKVRVHESRRERDAVLGDE